MKHARRGPVSCRAAGIQQQEDRMRAVLLWLLGIPIPIIILLYVSHLV
ncbi:MAG: hypothetical protein JO162_13170 [Alphaproteobacteria bacterium]|nr:hypothetical protein [Alphaproteobacteria bacterium]MBV9015852.1 hypothetical protein [Alphaproteobacteria bacterium]MBV9587790.1 hypothetical protein [Alphaproteobacteria bacterium]MBV9966741.1 hypothetical protein [Alphaproteobacteria bacterium]